MAFIFSKDSLHDHGLPSVLGLGEAQRYLREDFHGGARIFPRSSGIGILYFHSQTRKGNILSSIAFSIADSFLERAGHCFFALHSRHNNILRKQNKRKEKVAHGPPPPKSNCFLFPQFGVSEIGLGKDRDSILFRSGGASLTLSKRWGS